MAFAWVVLFRDDWGSRSLGPRQLHLSCPQNRWRLVLASLVFALLGTFFIATGMVVALLGGFHCQI